MENGNEPLSSSYAIDQFGPRVSSGCRGVALKGEDVDNPFPDRFTLKFLVDGNGLNVGGLASVESPNGIP